MVLEDFKMSIEKINQAKAEIAATSAYKTITAFFDADSFCEIDAFAKSGEGFAEVVAGFGTVEGMPVYAFAQNSDICGGARLPSLKSCMVLHSRQALLL
jgi:acetyl-CoA carboxylase carboxyltransferase component